MASIIDLENNKIVFNSKEIMVLIDINNHFWFKAKDVTEILEYVKTKTAIVKHVEFNHKKLFCDMTNLKSTTDKYIHPMTVFIDESGLESLVLNSKKSTQECKTWLRAEVLPSMTVYKNQEEKMLTIDEFISKREIPLSKNAIFLELWTSLYGKSEVLVTENLLNWIEFGHDLTRPQIGDMSDSNIFKKKINKFIENLRENNIKYEQIDYRHQKCENYREIVNYINTSNPHTLHLKKWLILSIRNFKEAIMMLNSPKSREVRKYYLNLEELMISYMEYTKNYKIKQLELQNIESKKIITKTQKIIEESKEKMQELTENFTQQLKLRDEENNKIQNYINRIILKEKIEYIYIVTNDNLLKNNVFKVGKTSNLVNRLKPYNTGNIDNFYYVFYKKVYDGSTIENIFKTRFRNFQYDKKELFQLYIDDLIYYIEKIIDDDNNFNDVLSDQNVILELIKRATTLKSKIKPIEIKETITSTITANNEIISTDKIIINDQMSDEEINQIILSIFEKYISINTLVNNTLWRSDFINYTLKNNIAIKNKNRFWHNMKTSLSDIVTLRYK